MGLQGYLAHRVYRGTSLIRNRLPSQDHHRALGIVLLQGARGALLLMGEVPLQVAVGKFILCSCLMPRSKHRGTSPIRNSAPLAPYNRTMPRAL